MPDPKTPSITRRQFATTALLTATAATLGAATSANAANSADAAQSPAPPLPEASQSESAQRLQTILTLYGSRFSDDQKADLKKICNNTQTSLDRLRAYPTDNADDPPSTSSRYGTRKKSRRHPDRQTPIPGNAKNPFKEPTRCPPKKSSISQSPNYPNASNPKNFLPSISPGSISTAAKLGPQLNAYARLTPEIALEQATAAEKEIHRGHYRGPLHGIPYAAKDLLAVSGIPTTWGAKPYANQVFDYDAAVIDHLRSVGAVLIGKAAMIELAGGLGYRFANASLQGAAKNPWDTTCWTCGSSSGSGAIVAAGLAAFAIGTETWGSIVCPAAFCGVSGLRPTYGRVSRYGAMALAPSMDKIGPLARSAEDCAHIFAAIAGHDPRDRSTLPIDKAAFTYSPATQQSAPAAPRLADQRLAEHRSRK